MTPVFDNLLRSSSPSNASGSLQNPNSLSGSSEIEVLIVDDHPAIREAVSSAVDREQGMRLVRALGTSEQAQAFLQDHSPDVFIVDISLGEVDGLALIEGVLAEQPEMKVLVYSMHDEDRFAGRALRAGALGYVHKSSPTEQVITAIHRIEDGEIALSREIASQILANVIRNNEYGSEVTEQLTDRELTVFRMIGSGTTVRDIADQLDLSRKTVETYRRRAKEKLGYNTVDDLLQFAMEWCNKEANSD